MPVKIFACGDIVNTRNNDGLICGAEIEKIIQQADYSVCNFEAPIECNGKPIKKSGIHIQNKKNTIESLKKHGFDLLLLANNHIMDYGYTGLSSTLELAKKYDLETIGAGKNFSTAYAPLEKNIKGLKFGFINACEAQFGVLDYFQKENTPGYAWINHSEIDKRILSLRKSCDFVIVFSHAGLENYHIPQHQWRKRYQHLCDLGADVIVGSHPHVPQGYEQYKKSLIFYSLGNFYFDRAHWDKKNNDSYAVLLHFEKGAQPYFKPILHQTVNRKVELQTSLPTTDINYLCSLLKNPQYDIEHKKMTLQAYKNIHNNILRAVAPIPLGNSFKTTLKEIAATLLGRRKYSKNTLFLHLLRNEAYYYTIKNALEIKEENK